MSRTFYLLVFFTIYFLSTYAFAERSLTLQDSLAQASYSNPDLRTSEEALHKARYKYYGSYCPLLPQIGANGGINRNRNINSSEDGYINENDFVELTVQQSIFSGGRNQANISLSYAEKELAEIRLELVRSQLTYDVREAFAQLLFAQEQLLVMQAIAERRNSDVQLLELRYEGGREHRGNLLYTKASYKQALFDVDVARRALIVAQRRLARTMGTSEKEDLRAVGKLESKTPAVVTDFSDRALETPAYRLALTQIKSARAGVDLARSEFLPDIFARAAATRQNNQWPPNQDGWFLGVNFTYPFFPGGQNVLDLKGAKAEERRTEAAARSADDQATFDLEQSYNLYADAYEHVAVQTEFLNAAESRAEVARSQYTIGLLSFDNWDIIENDLINQRKFQLISQRDAVLAEAVWERVQGLSRLPE